METATRKCRVCGAEYEYCHTLRTVAGVFRWQDVACCPEHGSEYLALVMASRQKPATDATAEKSIAVANEEEPAIVREEQEPRSRKRRKKK